MTKRQKARPLAGDLLPARIVAEQEWAYARFLERYGFGQMRVLAALPPDRGGLGYDLSESALRGLVKGARERRGDVDWSKAERIERQSAELDELARGARNRIRAASEIGEADPAAEMLLLKAQEREERLHGLAAALHIKADVTTHDAVTAELNAMLARSGRKPVKEPKTKKG